MSVSRNPSFEVVHSGGRELVAKSGLIRPAVDFPQSEQVKKRINIGKCSISSTIGSNVVYLKMLYFASLADVCNLLGKFRVSLFNENIANFNVATACTTFLNFYFLVDDANKATNFQRHYYF